MEQVEEGPGEDHDVVDVEPGRYDGSRVSHTYNSTDKYYKDAIIFQKNYADPFFETADMLK